MVYFSPRSTSGLPWTISAKIIQSDQNKLEMKTEKLYSFCCAERSKLRRGWGHAQHSIVVLRNPRWWKKRTIFAGNKQDMIQESRNTPDQNKRRRLLLNHPFQQSMEMKVKANVRHQIKIWVKIPKKLLLKINELYLLLDHPCQQSMKLKANVKMFLDREKRLETWILKLHHERMVVCLSETDSDASPIKKMPRKQIPGTLWQILMEMIKRLILIAFQILKMSHKLEEAEKWDNQ